MSVMTATSTSPKGAIQVSDVMLGCGYCTHCGYGGEPSPNCLHKSAPYYGPVRRCCAGRDFPQHSSKGEPLNRNLIRRPTR